MAAAFGRAGSLGVFELELIIERTRAAGLAGRVTVSYAYALAQADAGPAGGRPGRSGRAAGVSVACGHDDIRDLWSPFGSGDLQRRPRPGARRLRTS
ncbi:hypothetical protein AB0J40_28535 [Amycolatopsis sp. NPDC049691]|uniref:hypothetical protein n=1 Tax=Amycolatopsis sp. NPDC049691 TaxID=3155155 RepID=UPI00341C01A5